MQPDELRELLTPEGLRLLDSLPPYESKTDVVRMVSSLRAAGHSPALVAAVLAQSKLRGRARAKFGEFASRMLFTEAGLEQATRLPVAAQHAGRFRSAGAVRVADLGCGIGGDALAFASLDLAVTAVERDEVTAAIAAYNLAPFDTVEVLQADVTQVDLAGTDAAWLDPARRTTDRGATTARSWDPADWSPSLDFVFGLAERMPVGVKLGPGVDRDVVPPNAEAQWISAGREVVELVLWFGELARPGIRRSALLVGNDGTHELTAAGDSDDAPVRELGAYLYEPDGSVIRARLIGDLARALDAGMVSEQIAYLTADAAVETPFASCFAIDAVLPLDERAIRRELAARGIGTLEIKKRGVDVDPAQFRKRLSLRGRGEATLALTRLGERRVALLTQRVRFS
ncbi:class I SAM-dependent methyltransferase [Herbiconiux sp. SYSU D00978]|uniref:class I SAM-dependent methyltransferase n=1 Tax=Herbiconiux sp. SYSU D00978 TaxID=2812562 RepID=UPI001A969746|nr:class I SAM-dependent methyltransferase [Herbiconiux sp. SYSU D00978]